MTGHPRVEVEAAFRHYFLTGPVYEDWIAWSQLFTDDAARRAVPERLGAKRQERES